MRDAVLAQSPSGGPLSSERGALTVQGSALAAAATAARQNAPAPSRVEGAAGNVLTEDDLPLGNRLELVLTARTSAAQGRTIAAQVLRCSELRDSGSR
jgi:hypothetical protein